MRKLPSRKLLATLVAGALFIPQTGFTLGLGEIEVSSALNQKLKADIELLSATPEDTENIIVKLASRKEFSRAGLDRPYLLNDLRFKPEVIDGVPHIKVSSSSPIREPFLNFLIEIDWPNGHLLREYTVLLDPPAFMTAAASKPVSSAPPSRRSESRPAAVTAATQPVVVAAAKAPSESVAPAFTSAPVVQQQTPINQPTGSYRIKSGDTAWKLAEKMRPDQNVSVPQMMFAMLRANPEAFINENINGIKRGYILRMPDAAQIAAISKADARAMMREHWAIWRQYQKSLSGEQPVSAMPVASAPAAKQGVSSDSGDADIAAAKDARLAIVSAGTGASTAGSKDPSEMSAEELRAELLLARERVETERVEKEALQSRLSTLEQNAAQREGLLTVEDEELSGVQSLNAQADMVPADDQSVAAESVDSAVSDDMATESAGGETVDPELQGAEVVDSSGEQVVAQTEDAIFTDEVSGAPADETMAAEPVSRTPDMETPQTGSIQTEDEGRAAADPLSQLINNPMLLAAAGGGLLLIAAMIGLILKRRRTAAEDAEPVVKSGFADIESIADDIAEETTTAEAAGAGQVADEQGSFVSGSDSSAQETHADADEVAAVKDEEPRDDVLAEADVYLAYGIYQQAEDLLKQAISENPERNDYRVKLAETHYASKNAAAFSEVAAEIKSRTDDDAPEWQKVLLMGQNLCADNPMFKGATIADLDLGEVTPEEPPMDFDLGVAEEHMGEIPDQDPGMEDELELPEMSESAEAAEEISEAEQAEDLMSAEPAEEIEFDISDTGALDENTAEAEDEFSLDIDASELDINIDMDEDELSAETSSDEVHEIDDTDMEFGLDETVEDASAEEDISLDLSGEIEDTDKPDEAKAAIVSAANDDSAEEDDFDLSSLGDVDEVSTKLDLARAYLDMGDHDGTRDILEEVLADGNDEQKQEASELMAKLA